MSRIRLLAPMLSMALLLALWWGAATPALAQSNSYVVQPGDTLFSIAQRHGTTPDHLMQLNGLSGPTIYVGQHLAVPGGGSSSAPAPAGSYVVRSGDTLYSIATRHNMTVESLRALNGLASDFIYAGQVLRVSGSAPAPRAPSAPATASGGTYVVRAGDTLFSIAVRQGTTVLAIKQANGFTTDTIYVGQRLVLPGYSGPAPAPVPAPQPPVYYYVQPGDSLTHIAALHGVSVGALAQLNSLRIGDWVYVGQRLLVPSGVHRPAPPPVAPPPVPGQSYYHIVRPGETLSWIAAYYKTTVHALATANRLADPSHIFVGQRLAVPGYARPVAQPAATPTPRPTPKPVRPAPTAAPPYVPPSPPSTDAPTVTRVWRGMVASSTCGREDSREFRSVVRVTVEGRTGQTVDLFAQPVQDSTFITWVQTGNKAELGPYTAEIAPLGAGNYVVSVPGIGSVGFYLDGKCTLDVTFALVPR